MKILLSGVSGIGKTTMAQILSEKYKIPFIIGSSKVLWRKYHIDSHRMLIDRCNSSNQFALDFQYELLEYRKNEMAKNDRFVTDRGPLDNLVYFLLQLSHNVSQFETAKYIEACIDSLPKDVLQIYFTFDPVILKSMNHLENDGARITNNYYQLMVASVFNMVLHQDYLKSRIDEIDMWDLQQRMISIEILINNRYGGQASSSNLLF